MPVISSVSPNSAYAGQTSPIEINGINFGTGTPTVTFNGVAATSFSYLSPSVIVPFVPAGATTGSVVVTAGGIASVGVPFTIIPQPTITSISPTSGTPGTPIIISGANLTGCTELTFGGAGINVVPSATSISTLVQTGAAAASGGTVQVAAFCGGFETNSLAFTVLPAPPPAVATVSPSTVYQAQTYGSHLVNITLTGTNFGTSGTVIFNGSSPISYLSQDGKTIVVSAFTATTGPLTVTTSGASSNGVTFTVAPTPTVTSVSPRSGQVGSTMQLTGTNLTGCSTLLFNTTPVTVSPSSPTNLTAVVPSAAIAGPEPMSVVCNGYQTNSAQFTVGTAYDNGNVALTVNGVTDSVPYGGTSNTTSAALAASLILAVNADPNAFVNASASGSTGITLTSRNPGTASAYPFSLADNYDAYDFSAPSFASTPLSGTLAGGANAVVTQTPAVYTFSIPSPGTATTGYDPDSNLLSYTDNIMGNWSFGYDPLNRLQSALVISGMNHGINFAGATLGWTYDQFGNRLTQSSSSGVLPTGSVQFARADNQATGTGLVSSPLVSSTTFQYDAAGNLNSKNGAVQSVFDAEGRLCATDNLTGGYEGYLYDAAGNRVAKGTITTLSCDTTVNGFVLTSQYLLGPSGEQMTELNGSGVWVHTNVSANGSLIATFDNDNRGAHFYLTDWLGTRRVQTNYLGAVENTWTSLPYGDALASSASVEPTEHHFTGKERDTESGLDYFGARYYASNMGRFMSPDWASNPQAVPYASYANPQSLNLYNYMRNNPLSGVDADGHLPIYGIGDVINLAKNVAIGVGKVAANALNFIGGDCGGCQSRLSPMLAPSNAQQAITMAVAPLVAGPIADAAFGGSVTVTAGAPAAMEVTPSSLSAGEIQSALADAPYQTTQTNISGPMVNQYIDKLNAGETAPAIKMDGNVIVDGNHRAAAGYIQGTPPATTPGTSPQGLPARPLGQIKVDSVDYNHPN